MKGFTHLFFGMGFVGLLLFIFGVPNILWGVGTLIIAPYFSRLPDKDQKIAQITCNHIIPHRGKYSHNLLFGIPILIIFFVIDVPVLGTLLTLFIVSVFGALFAHAFVDAFNYSGVWLGVIKVKGYLEWDSIVGNLGFKIIGLILFFFSIFNVILNC